MGSDSGRRYSAALWSLPISSINLLLLELLSVRELVDKAFRECIDIVERVLVERVDLVERVLEDDVALLLLFPCPTNVLTLT